MVQFIALPVVLHNLGIRSNQPNYMCQRFIQTRHLASSPYIAYLDTPAGGGGGCPGLTPPYNAIMTAFIDCFHWTTLHWLLCYNQPTFGEGCDCDAYGFEVCPPR